MDSRRPVEELLAELGEVLDRGRNLGTQIARAARIARRADQPLTQGGWSEVSSRGTTFLSRLAEDLDARGMTRAELAKLLGIHKHHAVSYANGSQVPSLGVALRIARVLDVPVEHLWRLP